MINWTPIVDKVLSIDGEHVSLNHPENIPTTNLHFTKIINQLREGSYDFNSADWIDYYPSLHFDDSCVEAFSNLVGYKLCRAWISRVNPGKTAPWHWDVDDQEEEFTARGNLIRWTCFITPPKVGHSLIIGDQGFYNQPLGTIYKWPTHREWHCASNCGLEPQLLFHFLGYQ